MEFRKEETRLILAIDEDAYWFLTGLSCLRFDEDHLALLHYCDGVIPPWVLLSLEL